MDPGRRLSLVQAIREKANFKATSPMKLVDQRLSSCSSFSSDNLPEKLRSSDGSGSDGRGSSLCEADLEILPDALLALNQVWI